MFDKTRQFVDDTRFLSAIIFKKEFYEANGIFHSQAMDRYSRYVQVNVDELPKEVNSSPLQTCFDDYKRLLNSIDVPDVDLWGARQYIQDHLSTEGELVGDAVGILETIQEQCGLLRNAVDDFAEVYGLTCKEEKEDDEKPAVKPAEKPAESEEEKEPRTIPPNVIMAFKSAEAAEQFFAWKPYTTKEWDWGKRYRQYGVSEQARTKGCLKAVFQFLRQLHPDVGKREDTFRHGIRN